MIMKNKAIVFDLDDTLYSEYDFLKSGYHYISLQISKENADELYRNMLSIYKSGRNVFEYILVLYPELTLEQLLNWYRYHMPDIKLYDGVERFLQAVSSSYKFAIITDGRSISQRNKIKALGLQDYMSEIIISEEIGSEKPNESNFLKVENALNCNEYTYIGDNVKKDFITPKKLGWKTICLKDRGVNIHKQNFDLDEVYLPQHVILNWDEIYQFINV